MGNGNGGIQEEKEIAYKISGKAEKQNKKSKERSEKQNKKLSDAKEKLKKAKQGNYGQQQEIVDLIEERREKLTNTVQTCTEQMPFMYKWGTKLGVWSPKKFYQDQVTKLGKAIHSLGSSLESEVQDKEQMFKDQFKYEDLRNSAMYVIEENRYDIEVLASEISSKDVKLKSLDLLVDGKINRQAQTEDTSRESLIEEISLAREKKGQLEIESDSLLADAEMYQAEYDLAELQYNVSGETVQGLRNLRLTCKINKGHYMVAIKSINNGNKAMGIIDNAEEAALINAKLDEIFTNLYKAGVVLRPGGHVTRLGNKTKKTRIAEPQIKQTFDNGTVFEARYESLKKTIKNQYQDQGPVSTPKQENHTTM